MPDEKAPSSGAFLLASLMYFCSGQPMHYCSGVDIRARRRLPVMSANRHSPSQTHNQGTGSLFPAEKRARPCGLRVCPLRHHV
jgi:hypothetical protein